MDVAGYFPGEWPTVYHLLQAQGRQQMRAIAEVTDILCMVHSTRTGIMGTFFFQFLRDKFDITVLEDRYVYELGKNICGLVLPEVKERLRSQEQQTNCVTYLDTEGNQSPWGR